MPALPIALPSELTIYQVAQLRIEWLALLDKPEPDKPSKARRAAGRASASTGELCLDGAGVHAVDGAGVQLLVALAHSLAARQRSLQVREPSDILRKACASLGAAELLAMAPAR